MLNILIKSREKINEKQYDSVFFFIKYSYKTETITNRYDSRRKK